MVLGVVKRLGVVDDLDRRAAAELQLHATFRGLAVLDELLRAVLMDDDGHSAGGDVLHRDLDGRLVGVVRHVDFDLCGGIGVLRCRNTLHGNGYGFALLLRLLHIPVAELGAGLGRGVALGVGLCHRGPRGSAAGAGRGGLRLGPIGLGLRLRGGPVGVLHRVGLRPRRHRPGGTAGAGLVPEGDGAGEVVVVISVSWDKLPSVGGVGADRGVHIHLCSVGVDPVDGTFGPVFVDGQASVFKCLAAGGDGRVGGRAGGGGLVHQESDRVGGGEIVHGVVRGEGPAIGRPACGGNGGEGGLPGDGAGDHLFVHGRLGAELDVAQGHAVDDGVGGHGDEHTQSLLVHRPEVHGEGDGLVVGGRDLDGDSADGAGRRDGILVDGQDQLAVFDLRITVRVITGGQLHGGLRILDFAVGPGAFQRGQGEQVDGVGVRQIVDDVQRDFVVEGGHGGLFDVEGRSRRRVGLLRREIRIGQGLVSGCDSRDVDNLGRVKDEVLVFQRDRLVDGLILARVSGDKLCGGHFVIARFQRNVRINALPAEEVGKPCIRSRQGGGAVVGFCVRLAALEDRPEQLVRNDLPVEGFRAFVVRAGIRGRDGQLIVADLSRSGTCVGEVTIAQLILLTIRCHFDRA